MQSSETAPINRAFFVNHSSFWLTRVIAVLFLLNIPVHSAEFFPAMVGKWPEYRRGSFASAVEVAGNIAYVATGNLMIFDVSNPIEPKRLSECIVEGGAFDVAIQGTNAYVAAGSRGFQIIDISDPRNPRKLGRIRIDSSLGTTYAVAVSGTNAFIVGTPALTIVDVSDPSAPKIAGTYGADYTATAVVVEGNWALVATVPEGHHSPGLIRVIDINDPVNPRQVDYCPSGWPASKPIVHDNILCLPTTYDLDIFDISDLPKIRFVGRWDDLSNGKGVAVAGNTAYLAADNLEVIDISDPTNTTHLAQFPMARGEDVAVAGEVVYVASRGAGFSAIDISNPVAPRLLSACQTGGSSTDTAVVGNIAYVADGWAGLQVLDVSNPSNPKQIGGFDTDGRATGIEVDGNIAYVTDGNLIIIDITNPTQSRQLGAVLVGGYAIRATVVQHTAYLAVGGAGLEVFDISDPTAPRRLGGIGTTGRTLDVAVEKNVAFVADQQGGLQIINVANPADLRRMSEIKTRWRANRVKVEDNIAYVTDFWSGFAMIDVSNPMSPKRLGGYEVESFMIGLVQDLAVAGNRVYVSSSGTTVASEIVGQGVRIFDVSDPSQPRLAGFNPSLLAYGLHVANGKLYMSAGVDGVKIFDLLAFRSVSQFGLDSLIIEWNQSAVGMTLQQCTNLIRPTWKDVSGSESTNRAVLPTHNSRHEFFRLIKK